MYTTITSKKYGKQRQDRLCIIALHTQVVELTNICGIHVSVGMHVHTVMQATLTNSYYRKLFILRTQ